MSALARTADSSRTPRHVRNGPSADIRGSIENLVGADDLVEIRRGVLTQLNHVPLKMS